MGKYVCQLSEIYWHTEMSPGLKWIIASWAHENDYMICPPQSEQCGSNYCKKSGKVDFLSEYQFGFVGWFNEQRWYKWEHFVMSCPSSRFTLKILAHYVVSILHCKSSFWRSSIKENITLCLQSDHFYPRFGVVYSYEGCNETVSKAKGWNVLIQENGVLEVEKSS